MTETADAFNAWSRHLLDDLPRLLAEGDRRGLPMIFPVMAAALITHGAQFGTRTVGIPPVFMANYLRLLADAIESEAPLLPVLTLIPDETA